MDQLRSLREAAEAGKLQTVKKLLDQGVDIEATCDDKVLIHEV